MCTAFLFFFLYQEVYLGMNPKEQDWGLGRVKQSRQEEKAIQGWITELIKLDTTTGSQGSVILGAVQNVPRNCPWKVGISPLASVRFG